MKKTIACISAIIIVAFIIQLLLPINNTESVLIDDNLLQLSVVNDKTYLLNRSNEILKIQIFNDKKYAIDQTYTAYPGKLVNISKSFGYNEKYKCIIGVFNEKGQEIRQYTVEKL